MLVPISKSNNFSESKLKSKSKNCFPKTKAQAENMYTAATGGMEAQLYLY